MPTRNFSRVTLLAVGLVLVLVSVAQAKHDHGKHHHDKHAKPKHLEISTDGDLSFLVIGDWGGQDTAPYTTAGERALAKQIAKTAVSDNTQFVLAVGDNFYDNGVESTDDSRFNTTFSDVFAAKSLQVPWFVVAGNHDWIGSVDAQVEYSKINSVWNFPSYYYCVNYTVKNQGNPFNVQFIYIDTVRIVDQGDDDQLAWLETTLSESTADWIIVVGHYPIYSVGEHGTNSQMLTSVKPLLEKYKVASYICGHDHNMQHIKLDNSDISYYLSGAGHALVYNQDHASTVPSDALKFYYPPTKSNDAVSAFLSVQLNKDKMVVSYINDQGNTVYQASNGNPRA